MHSPITSSLGRRAAVAVATAGAALAVLASSAAAATTVRTTSFGKLDDGTAIQKWTLTNANRMSVSIMSIFLLEGYGAASPPRTLLLGRFGEASSPPKPPQSNQDDATTV